MSIKISGLKLLDANFYNRILIIEKNNNYKVYVKRDKKVIDGIGSLECIPVGYIFSEEIKSKSEEEKIRLITEKFLEYTRISKVNINYSWNTRLDSFKTITASGTREFKLQLFNLNLESFSQMILKKYINDRLNFMSEFEDVNTISISLDGHTSYEKNAQHIKLSLLSKNSELESFEREFLENLIYTKLEKTKGHAVIVPTCHMNPIFIHKESLIDYVLKCGDLIINLGKDRKLIEEVQRIINNYETDLRNQKIMHMQLKMEGF